MTVVAKVQFLLKLMGSLAIVALLFTATGLYGVLSYAVERRRREIGVRIALGAGRSEVLSLVFRQAMRLAATGLVSGVAGVALTGRVLSTVVQGIEPLNHLVLLGSACCTLVLVSLAAAYIPATRAGAVDPIHALRSE